MKKNLIIEIADLLTIADAYIKAVSKVGAPLEDKTLSGRVFGDSKKLTYIRDGKGITADRFNYAVRWFSVNWPEDAVWPEQFLRPDPTEAAEAIKKAAES